MSVVQEPGPLLLKAWRAAPAAQQDQDWQEQRAALSAALLQEALTSESALLSDPSPWAWIGLLAFLTAAPELPGSSVAGAPVPATSAVAEAQWLQWAAISPSEPMPLDMEADALAEGVEQQDQEHLLPLLSSMAADEKARLLVLERLGQRMAEDSYRQGQRAILFQQWMQLGESANAVAFAALTLRCLQQHWCWPTGCAVVVPEGKAERRGDGDKALLQSLRERDLGAYMSHVRALGDQPIAALRQLFLAVGLMIMEYPAGTRLAELARLYLWLGAVLSTPHKSLRRARRVLFSVAAAVFACGGWQAQSDWPSYAALAAHRHSLLEGELPDLRVDWQRALWSHAHGTETSTQWWLERAQRHLAPSSSTDTELFWPLWQQTRRAAQLTGGPLDWIHPLVLLRLYPD